MLRFRQAMHGEAAALADRLLAEAITAQGVEPGTLNGHADRGTSMTSKPVALLLADLGVTKSHARPHVPDDNPYSESQFKTLKHHSTFPERFVRKPPHPTPPRPPQAVWINKPLVLCH